MTGPSTTERPPVVGRFAPSTTGPAHPGTLLAALLCWLDARSRRGRIVLRLEDLDAQRSDERWARRLEADLSWLGLDWDRVVRQGAARAAHERALDRLAELGVLYPCQCSRAQVREAGRPSPDGGFAYPGTCRGRPLPSGGWRDGVPPLRVALPDAVQRPRDEGGTDLTQNARREMGDPVVLRRDGAVAYHLASVVDDFELGVTRVVRGRDLAPSTATQVALQDLLGAPRPEYRHHLLLLEARGGKLAKLHGSVGIDDLRPGMDGPALCGWLAAAVGLRADATPVRPTDLVDAFDWSRVRRRDLVVRFTGGELRAIDRVSPAGPDPAPV